MTRLLDLYQRLDMLPDDRDARLEHFADRPGLLKLAQQLVSERRVVYKQQQYCGLLLIGPTGTGKTWLASAIVHEAYEQGVAALYTTVAGFLSSLRSTYNREAPEDYNKVFGRALNAPLLVLDDFGVQKDTDWTWEQMDMLVDHRIGRALPTVVTTNLPLAEWNVERIASRMRRLLQVNMGGEDRR